jgi:phytanoyl-CoA hydroxylase
VVSQTKKGRTLHSYDTEEEQQLAKNIAETLYRYENLPSDRIPTLGDLTEAHVKQFWEQGYLVVDQILSPEEIHTSLEAVMDILYGKSTGSKIQFVKPRSELHTEEELELAARKVHDYIDHEPRLRNIAFHPDVMAAMGRLFGEEAKVVQDQHHGTPPNFSDKRRRSLQIHYGPESAQKLTPQAYKRMFTNEMTGAEC